MPNIDLRYPALSGTPEQQLTQLRSYLYQLIDQLNYAFRGADEGEKRKEKAQSTTVFDTDVYISNNLYVRNSDGDYAVLEDYINEVIDQRENS